MVNEQPTSMLALRQGGERAEQIVVSAGPVPRPAADDVLIRVEAAAINPSDLGVVLGHHSPTALEYIPGRDLAGVVEAGPPGLVGERVWATGGEFGTRRDGFHAEYAVLPATAVRSRPDGLSAEQAASVGVAFTTAWYGLVERGALQLGDRVLVTGAAGAVGTAAVQIARWAGLSRVGGLFLNDGEAETARRYGATISVSDPARLLEVDIPQQPTLCLDTVGGDVLDDIVHAMAPEGRIVNISTPGDGLVTFSLRDFYRRRLTLRGLATGTYDAIRGAQVLEIVGEGFASGALRAPDIAATFPLEQATDAYALMGTHPAGKIVLTMARAQ